MSKELAQYSGTLVIQILKVAGILTVTLQTSLSLQVLQCARHAHF